MTSNARGARLTAEIEANKALRPEPYDVREGAFLAGRCQVAAELDYRLSASDLCEWEGNHGRSAKSCLAFVTTGWYRHFSHL